MASQSLSQTEDILQAFQQVYSQLMQKVETVMMPTVRCAWNTHNDQCEVTDGSEWLCRCEDGIFRNYNDKQGCKRG